MKRVLVLGSAGQVGAALVEYLINQGYAVNGLDMEFDLRDPSNIEQLASHLDNADFCFFLAYDVGGSKYLAERQGSIDYLSNNVKIMDNFATAYSRCQTPPPFIFASSQMSNMLWSQYGVLKRLGEFYTEILGGINVRFWNVYGFESDPEKFHVISDFLISAMNGNDIHMRTDGSEKRQMLHAKDAARALEALMVSFYKLDVSEYYDITSFEWSTISQIAFIIAGMYDVQVYSGTKVDDVQQDAANEPTDLILNYWKPEISLSEGISEVAKRIREAGLVD